YSQDLYVEFTKDEQKYKENRIYERVKCYRLFPNISEKTIDNVLFRILLRMYRAFEYYLQRLLFIDRIKNMV
ncbi:TPA: hypothetical protein ACHVCM_002051, partial [Streptococcus suis]